MQQKEIAKSRFGEIELLLDEADHAAKETDVRYTHEEVFSRVKGSISKAHFLKEIDKGIDDMEEGRVIEHKEAMHILGNHFKT